MLAELLLSCCSYHQGEDPHMELVTSCHQERSVVSSNTDVLHAILSTWVGHITPYRLSCLGVSRIMH